MKTSYTNFPLRIFFIFTILTSNALAQSYEQEEEGMDYDTIIRKLSRGNVAEVTPVDPFDNVKMHLGVGFANSIFTVNHSEGDKTFGAQRGVQVALGIDLFSKNWLAEGTFRNFGEAKYENASIATKEFDLKLLYQTRFISTWSYRFGGGLAARYMSIDYFGTNGPYNRQYQTPASVVQGGLLTYLTESLSIGADAAIRNSLIDETPDRTSFDFTLRLDGHF